MPFILAVREYWYIHPRPPRADIASSSKPTSSFLREAVEGRGKYLVPTACLAVANALAALVLAGPRSTYICPLSSYAIKTVPLLQILGLLLDCYIAQCIAVILEEKPAMPSEVSAGPELIGSIFLVSTMGYIPLGRKLDIYLIVRSPLLSSLLEDSSYL